MYKVVCKAPLGPSTLDMWFYEPPYEYTHRELMGMLPYELQLRYYDWTFIYV